MHKPTQSLASLALLAVMASITPSVVQASTTIYQHQSSSSSFEFSCSGECSAKSETSQSQTQRVGEGSWPAHHGHHSAEHAPSGNATISWPHSGGTCTIRYTENSARWYKYTTSAGCDEGQLTIGGLVPGRTYRFQVKQEGAGWSTPTRIVAH